MCPNLNAPANGSVQLSGREVGSVANYSCDPGFVLTGAAAQLECAEDGQWDPLPPTCESKSQRAPCSKLVYSLYPGVLCPDPGNPENSRRVLLGDFSAGSRVYFVPRDGFETESETALLCQENGTWSATAPQFTAATPQRMLPAKLCSEVELAGS